jgi:hypothetical protein
MVLNSNLDLQITGKISEKVSLRASIQDSNIPLQMADIPEIRSI